jgi:hypothetical protein
LRSRKNIHSIDIDTPDETILRFEVI